MDELIGKFKADHGADDNRIFHLCDVVRETSFRIHQYLRSGHVEKVYENALAHRLRKQGIEVLQKEPLKVFDEDGAVIGKLEADLIIDNRLIAQAFPTCARI
jgi:GxxExxY protein